MIILVKSGEIFKKKTNKIILKKKKYLGISFGEFYYKHGDIKSMNKIFYKASQVDFKTLDDFINIW